MNWYTKRAALTGIYNTTELVMLQDSSPDFQDTWNFLDNRIQDIVNMAGTAKQVECSTARAKQRGEQMKCSHGGEVLRLLLILL